MAFDSRGDLIDHSKSLKDFAAETEKVLSKGTDTALKQAIGHILNAVRGGSDPSKAASDLVEQSVFWLKIAAGLTIRNFDAKQKAIAESVSENVTQKISRPARDLVFFLKETSPPHNIDVRVVPKMLFEQARLYYKWNGTLIEARHGGTLQPADPTGHFTIYIPSAKFAARGSFRMSITHLVFA